MYALGKKFEREYPFRGSIAHALFCIALLSANAFYVCSPHMHLFLENAFLLLCVGLMFYEEIEDLEDLDS